MIVADVGAGSGLFTRRFAAAVGPGGKVFAVDIDKRCVDHINQTCREQGIANVVGVVGKADSTELAAESVDLVFVCDSYHHFDRPTKMLASIHRALKPGGRLVLIDFTKEGKMKDHVRADKKTLVNDLAAAGFKLVDALDFLPDQYVLRLEKPR
jgi:ubiquinone/menaquinone biosynthesis C-methylase UbiE